MNESEFMQCHEDIKVVPDKSEIDLYVDLLLKLVELVESLPQRMCDEMEKREEVSKKLRMKQAEEMLESYRKSGEEINKMMYSGLINLERDNGKN